MAVGCLLLLLSRMAVALMGTIQASPATPINYSLTNHYLLSFVLNHLPLIIQKLLINH
jgi:hypothetical protein